MAGQAGAPRRRARLPAAAGAGLGAAGGGGGARRRAREAVADAAAGAAAAQRPGHVPAPCWLQLRRTPRAVCSAAPWEQEARNDVVQFEGFRVISRLPLNHTTRLKS